MNFRFTKMQGLGNDFVVIDAVTQSVSMNAELAKAIADRRYGVGCDQILLVESTHHPDADFYFRIFNADGSEAYQCGNGARCASLFIQEQKLSHDKIVRLKTHTRVISTEWISENEVQVDMGKPNLDEKIVSVLLNGQSFEVTVVDMGNPHGVIFVSDFDSLNQEKVAQHLKLHPAFPQGVNVGFMRVITPTEIELRVIERGSGPTAACGSGACAAVAAGRHHGLLEETVTVHQLGGVLTISWPKSESVMHMRGPAKRVFNGEWINKLCC